MMIILKIKCQWNSKKIENSYFSQHREKSIKNQSEINLKSAKIYFGVVLDRFRRQIGPRAAPGRSPGFGVVAF